MPAITKAEANLALNDGRALVHTLYVDGVRQLAAIGEIVEERKYQDLKHGHPSVAPHSIGAWLLTIEAELFEAKEACIKGGEGRDNVISEIVQIAALCVACLEQHGIELIEGRTV